jgi:hypothetical protein
MESEKYNIWFNKKTISELINEKIEGQLLYQLGNSKRLYCEMASKYRNEFYYKNTIFNKYVIGTYSLNTTMALSEIEIATSKADFAIINRKKSFVVEIKTDLDTLDKLIYQIEDYYKVFSLVYVLTSENYYYQVYRLVKDTGAGIMVLTKRSNISIRKVAEEYNGKLKHENLFKMLKKEEYERLVESEFKNLPVVQPIFRYNTYLKLYKQLDIKKSQKLVFNSILSRINPENGEYLKRVPLELRWLTYQSHLNREKFQRLLNNIQRGI